MRCSTQIIVSSAGHSAHPFHLDDDTHRDAAPSFIALNETLPTEAALGNYRMLRPLGAGSAGSVFAAYDMELGREVAQIWDRRDREQGLLTRETYQAIGAKANATPEVEARREIMKELELIQQDRGSIGNAYFFPTWMIMNKKFQDVHAPPHRLSPLGRPLVRPGGLEKKTVMAR